MSNRRITQLTEHLNPNTTDVLPIVDKGSFPSITKQATLDNIVASSTYSTRKINNLSDPSGLNPGFTFPETDQLVVQSVDGSDPKKVRLRNIYPLTVNSDTINISFSNSNRNLTASIRTGSINGTHLSTGLAFTPTGGGTDRVFYENNQTVTTNYTITQGFNAMSTGPVTILNGVTITIPNGSTWSIIF